MIMFVLLYLYEIIIGLFLMLYLNYRLLIFNGHVHRVHGLFCIEFFQFRITLKLYYILKEEV